jgi:serralysin
LGTDTIVETTTGGVDTLDFSVTTVGISVTLNSTTLQTVNNNLKLILSADNVIENARGGGSEDRITGNNLDNTLIGGLGNDQLQGLGGNDILWGGNSNDILTGGAGNDTYLFQDSSPFTPGIGRDAISEFVKGQDKIVLSKTTFTAITNSAGQSLTDFAVVADNSLVDGSNARIVYSRNTGGLFYNQNGSALTGTFEFARLGNPDITLSSSDFTVII